MKLYYSPGACSLHPQIDLREAGIPFDMVRVDIRAHKLSDGTDFYAVNPKGYVPVLELDDGTRLTEGAVIAQWIADQKPKSALAAPAGTIERVHQQEWLHFIGSEVHKAFGPLFSPATPDDAKAQARDRVAKRFDYVEKELGAKSYLFGDTFTIADAYLFNMLRWTKFTGIDLSRWPGLAAYAVRIENRPAVKAALEADKG
jgi:glutathione S-transferase